MAKHLSTHERILGRLTFGPGEVEELELVAGTGVTLTVDAASGTITIEASGGGSGVDDDQGTAVLMSQAFG